MSATEFQTYGLNAALLSIVASAALGLVTVALVPWFSAPRIIFFKVER